MSNYCACSGGDEEYTIELNQQGPEGPQGEVGPEGFSPSISVKTNTDEAYILTVVNKEGSFDTPNLYGEVEKLNADLSNIPNPAYINGISLSNSEENISSIDFNGSKITTDVDGNLILTASAADEEGTETFNYEVVVNPKEQRLELHDNEGTVKIVATTDQQANVDIATTEKAGIVKPDGSTITVTPDGTISAVQPDLSNYVTNDELAVDLQDINSKIASKLDTATYEADKATYATKEELASTDATVTNLQTSVASNTTSIGTLREDLSNLETTVGNNSADIAALDADKLEQSNIIAGANITIDRSGNNLTISSTGGGGGGGAAIDDGSITSVSTWSSSKINSEITTVANTKNDKIFDIGKFTVVGNPVISEDGVVSGFSTSNYIKTNISLGDLKDKSWSVSNKWVNQGITADSGSDANPLVILGNPDYVSLRSGITMTELNSAKTVGFYVNAGDPSQETTTGETPRARKDYTSTGLPDWLIATMTFDISTGTYYFYIEDSFTSSKILLGTYVPTTDSKQLASVYNNSEYMISSGRGIVRYVKNAIDLSQFSITVDDEVVFNGLMESTKPIYDKIANTNTELSTFQTDTDNNFSAVNSALNEKANLSDLAGYVTVTKYNELLARVVALETEINGGNA